jgi:hypothetical protein
MRMANLKLTILMVLVAVSGTTAISARVSVDYPSNYRSWQHLKSMIIQPGHALEHPFGGIHHVYANSRAMSGLANGQYETGAVFVFDLLEYIENDKTIVESDRKRIDVMQYDSQKYSDTGGWGYDTFVGDSSTERLDQDVTVACHACHTGAKVSNYVYSKYRP